MKNTTRAILFCCAAFTTSVIYGGQETTGVSGVTVIVKEHPNQRAVTDRDGKFTLAGLPPGSYTLSFHAQRVKDLPVWHRMTGDKAIVATQFSINLEGTKTAANRDGLNTNQLLDGVDIVVKVGTGAQLRGEVMARDPRKWVWIPKPVDSNLPGHWALEGSQEADRHNIAAHAPHTWNFR